MKIGLLSIDGFNYPNLALMKISAYHKSIGDSVEWCLMGNYDRTYMSKIFTFVYEDIPGFNNYGEIIKGGTGYNMDTLPDYIDRMYPDYSLYPQFKQAYGFLTRGCPNKCSWCIVPQKEGQIRPYMTIEEIASDRKEIVLMDNNVLASEHGLIQIEQAIKLNLKLDFNQGLDARLIDTEVAKLLAKVKWKPYLRMACDSFSMKEPIRKATELLRKYGCKPNQYFIYVLLKNLEDSYDRISFCKKLNLKAFAQPFRTFTPNQIIPNWQIDMARYTNKMNIYQSIDFKDYQPRIGFKCSQYFT
jgi:radical SAM superfamily enzyme YgiQ (UPF0313 family)